MFGKFAVWAAATYLILTSEGLRYHTQTITIQTTWANIAQIHECALYPRIELERPAATAVSIWSERQRRMWHPGRSVDSASWFWL